MKRTVVFFYIKLTDGQSSANKQIKSQPSGHCLPPFLFSGNKIKTESRPSRRNPSRFCKYSNFLSNSEYPIPASQNHKGDRISRCLSRISELFTTIISQNFTLKGTLELEYNLNTGSRTSKAGFAPRSLFRCRQPQGSCKARL